MTDNCSIVVGSDASIVESRAAQAREVSKADSERRRIERALHDGVQQDLIALAVRLQLARRLVVPEPQSAVRLLDAIGRDVREALDRVRTLADGIYPSMLAAAGLPDALRAAGSAAGVPVSVDASGLGRLLPDVEATVYFCCRAALENVAAHAGPGCTTTIRIRRDGETLQVAVADDGAGFDPAVCTSGSGLTSMRDRIEAVGGVMAIESEPAHGTRIAASLPLYGASSAR
jgi:signal transduction histidine kinase